ncbi:hypothetical protein ZEAMMB73_Zm00001d027391 [Zea mays]|uniref:Uncharacterized protein n=1 Tax=Zea mays TaxID=4577 RepID=A0A1D6JLG8_MAIZE|nr:hypothetical protein ZEAMMB73_Zm00001d027391 [Zea mays]
MKPSRAVVEPRPCWKERRIANSKFLSPEQACTQALFCPPRARRDFSTRSPRNLPPFHPWPQSAAPNPPPHPCARNARTPRFLRPQPPQSAAFPSATAIVSIRRRSAATDNFSHAIPCPAPASAHPLALAPVFEEVVTLPPSSTPPALPHPPNPWSLLDSPDYRGAARRIYGAASVLVGIRRGGSCLPGIGAACLRSEMDRIRDDRRGGVSAGGVPRPPRKRLRSNGGGGPRDSPRSERRRGERLMLFGGGGCASRDHSDDISDESLGGDDAEQELARRYHQQRRSPSTAPPPPSPPLLHHASAPRLRNVHPVGVNRIISVGVPRVLPDERIHRFVGTDKFVFLAREALDIFKHRGCCRSTDRQPMLCVALFRSGKRAAQLHPVDPALWACAAVMEDPRGADRRKRRMSREGAGGGTWCRGHLSFQGQDLRAAATTATGRSKSICEKKPEQGIERAFCAGGDLAALVRSSEVEQQGRGRTLVSGRRAAGSGPAASGRFMPLVSFVWAFHAPGFCTCLVTLTKKGELYKTHNERRDRLTMKINIDENGKSLKESGAKQHFVDEFFTLKEQYDLSEDTVIGLRSMGSVSTCSLCLSEWAVARDPKVWSNPLQYRPERFLEENIDIKGSDFKVPSFGVGRHVCPGAQLGINLVAFMIGHLLHYFEWSLPEGTRPEDINMMESPRLVTFMGTLLQAVANPCLEKELYNRAHRCKI